MYPLRYTLVLRYYVNGAEPAFYTAEAGERFETRYAGQGMWVVPEGVFDSIDECLDEAENKFKDAGYTFIRDGDCVMESHKV
jgi:hypothetical protein